VPTGEEGIERKELAKECNISVWKLVQEILPQLEGGDLIVQKDDPRDGRKKLIVPVKGI